MISLCTLTNPIKSARNSWMEMEKTVLSRIRKKKTSNTLGLWSAVLSVDHQFKSHDGRNKNNSNDSQNAAIIKQARWSMDNGQYCKVV